jgi:hypothetical protein
MDMRKALAAKQMRIGVEPSAQYDTPYKGMSEALQSVFDFTRENPLDAATMAAQVIPGVGDAAGLANDIRHYVNDPESRTWGNAALTAVGALPFVPPAMGMTKALKGAVSDDLIYAIKSQDNPNAMKPMLLDDDFAREVAGEYLDQTDTLPGMNVVNDARDVIKRKAQEFLKDHPEIMDVYRSGDLRPGEIQSFTTNPNYNVSSNLPWNQGAKGSIDPTLASGTELMPYQVNKADISGVPDSLSLRGKFGEDELLINSDLVRVLNENHNSR